MAEQINELAATPPTPPYIVYSYEDLAAQEFERESAILGGDMLDVSSGMMITGVQKTGKTFFASQLCLSAAAGHSFLGFPAPSRKRHTTLYLNGELAPHRAQQRIIRQLDAFDEESARHVYMAFTGSRLQLDTRQGVDDLKRMIDTYEPDILVIDPLAYFHSGEENSNTDVQRVLAVFNGLKEQGLAVILVHHEGKGAEFAGNVGHRGRGSSALPGWYDTCLSIQHVSKEAPTLRRIEFELRNGEPVDPIEVSLDKRTFTYEAADKGDLLTGRVLNVVREAGSHGVKHTDLVKRFLSVDPNIRTLIDELAAEGAMEVLTKSTKGRSGKVYVAPEWIESGMVGR